MEKQIIGPNEGYWTHLTPLIGAFLRTQGPVLELGCGNFSTPILHELCLANGRMLFSYDNDSAWVEKFLDLRCNWHHFHLVLKLIKDLEHHFGLAFIDHGPAEARGVAINTLLNKVDVFVIHDAELPAYYGYDWSLFRYVRTYKRYSKTTAVCSNLIDLSKWSVLD